MMETQTVVSEKAFRTHRFLRPVQNVRVATQSETHASCRNLVQRDYARKGYTVSGNSEKSATTFYIGDDSQVAATISVIEDSSHGLPLDQIFGDYANSFRSSGKKLAEVGKFATDPDSSRIGLRAATMQLLSKVLQFAVDTEVDVLCITVNPKHVSFYITLGFSCDDSERVHPTVNAPARFLYFEIDKWLHHQPISGTIQ